MSKGWLMASWAVAWLFSLIACVRWLDIDARHIRDLQRRVAELEQKK